ncbi:MAG: TasA family protein [bacterium]|nr:TasA family protein [bacterium]
MKKILLSVSVIAFVAVVIAGATGAFFSDTETSTGNTFTAGAIDLTVDNTSYYNGVFNPDTSWLQKDLEQGDLFFDFQDLKPGDWGEDTISLHVNNNDSWLCADVTLTDNSGMSSTEPELETEGEVEDGTTGPNDGELASRVHFAWWADDGDNVFESNETLLQSGTLGALDVGQTATVALADSEVNIWDGTGPLPGDSIRYVGKAWCFGDFQLTAVDQDALGYTGTLENPKGTNGPDVRNSGISCSGANEGNETQTDRVQADISFRAEQSRNNGSFLCSPQDPQSPIDQF